MGQGEREMASDNKSLGRFKLTGIPPAPRGIPQIQVSFDIDANGILQVSALDKTTGREQRITVQGTSTLSENEIKRMINDADLFAQDDRQRRERVEKRNKAKALTDQAQRRLKEVTLDFGSQFTSYYRRRIDVLCQELLDSLERNDERAIDRTEADLQDILYELNREVRLQYDEQKEEGFLETIKKTFLGDEDEEDFDRYNPRNNNYSRNNNYRSDNNYRQDLSNNSYNREKPTNRPSTRSYSEVPPRRSTSQNYRNIPPENDWDEDDDWF